jgi:endonuclease-3
VPAPPKDDRARTRRIVRDLGEAHPDARFELDFTTPLELLIALILAALFRDERVNAITPALFARYRSARDYASAPPDELEAQLREVNFYRQKTKAVQRCTAAIVTRFGGEVPRKLDDLLTLPYVGRKTANVLRGNAFGDPAIGVDRHVARLARHIGLTREEDPDRIEADLTAVVTRSDQVRFCQLLQWHGRRVCLARGPRCEVCVIQPFCDYGRVHPHGTAANEAKPARRTASAKTSPARKPAKKKTTAQTRAKKTGAKTKPRRAQSGRKTSSPGK